MTQDAARPPGWIEHEVPTLLARHQVPGLAVGVCDAAGTRWSATFGATTPGGRPVTTDTIFSIQSVSKMYTATAVMCAVRDGLVDLDTPLPAYLPDFSVHSEFEPEPQTRMTLRLLLSHRTGLVHEAPRGSNDDDTDESFEDHCASIRETRLQFPVGDRYSYSNLGVDLAALVLQRVAGTDFAGYVDRRLLQPSGLRRTTFDHATIAADPDRALGHVEGEPHPRLRVPMVGAGGAYASVDDALGYLRWHLDGGSDLLPVDLIRQMYPPAPDGDSGFSYGLGVAADRRNGRLVHHHGGGGFGFLCDYTWDPAAGLGVVVLTNSATHPFQHQLATRILDDAAPTDQTT